uniref:Metalloendopeptidase n=1 Tax=Graphocephala atropunctata TaxID=36148 RepID=A0A1B6KMP3_9HEMI
MSIFLFLATVLTVLEIILAYPTEGGRLSNVSLEEKEIDFEPRNVIVDSQFKWPTSRDGNVYIPYEIHNLEPDAENVLHQMIDLFRQKSCIRWIPRTTETDYVQVRPKYENGQPVGYCEAMVGRVGGRQHISVTSLCLGLWHNPRRWALAHEMMHTLGFFHEQQRPDSRCYIEVSPDGETDMVNNGVITDFLVDITFPYDFHSIMHYNIPSFFKTLQGETISIEGDEPSFLDWWKIKNAYCGYPHFCEYNKDVCDKHNAHISQCYLENRMKPFEKPNDRGWFKDPVKGM